jgi:Tol biopolymer transport system component
MNKKIVVICVCLFLIATMLGTSFALAKKPGGGKPPNDPPADPVIAFRTGNGPNPRIDVMNADGSNQATVFTNDLGIGHFTWSPDGNAIAAQVSVNRGGEYFYCLWRIDISIVNGVPQGSEPTELAQDIGYGPAWSPDGDVIAFIKHDGDDINAYIQTAPAIGGDIETIYTAPDGYDVHHPTWSRDASQMVFVQSGYGQRSLILLDLSDSSIITVYGPTNGNFKNLDWARTQDVLVFHYTVSTYDTGIYTLDLTETSPTPQAILVDGSPDSPSWSPDDTQLVFERTNKNARRVSVYTFSTEETEYLVKGRFPDWSRA